MYPLRRGAKYQQAIGAIDGYVSAAVYDVAMRYDCEDIKPNGNVRIAFRLLSGDPDVRYEVYEADKNGSVVNLDSVAKDDAISITTDHNGVFVVVMKDAVSVPVTAVRVTPDPAFAALGESVAFRAEVEGEGSPSQQVLWSVAGQTSADTSIDESGLLRVAADETAETLTVTARATADEKVAGRVEVSLYTLDDLTGDGKVNDSDVMAACRVLARKSMNIDPTDDEVRRGDLNGDTTVSIVDVMAICKLIASRP